MSKILILSGSPRVKGNTNHLVNQLQSYIKDTHEVNIVDTSKVRAVGCRACEACFKTGVACVFDEGFNEIADEIIEADVIVFASPVYWCSFPAQMKAVIDKFYALMKKPELVSKKKSALISVCAEPEIEEFKGVQQVYHSVLHFMDWTSIGEVLVPNCFELGDANTSVIKNQIEDLVKNL